jgi:hypothetical protein
VINECSVDEITENRKEQSREGRTRIPVRNERGAGIGVRENRDHESNVYRETRKESRLLRDPFSIQDSKVQQKAQKKRLVL